MQILENVPLKAYCTYCTGGPARYFFTPKNTSELKDAISWADAKEIPHEVIGFGGNILIADRGYDGLVICMRKFEKWCIRKENALFAGAGAMLNHVVHYAVNEGLRGLEKLSGIPSTIGGAVKMNAGAFGTEIKDYLSRVNTLKRKDNNLEEEMFDTPRCNFGYRKSEGLKERIVLAAEFELIEGDREALKKARQEILESRAAKQPLEFPSCGSVFKRAGEIPAGKLIEECGLKRVRIGGAEVSEKHANFIVNTGNASSDDILNLIDLVKQRVFMAKKVALAEEVKYIGF